MQEMNIIPPEGYEIDKENSTFERIIFKKKITRPKSWKEFCELNISGIEYFIDECCYIDQTGNGTYRSEECDKNLCKTKKEAEAFLALIQLRRLWWEWKDENTEQHNYKWYYYYFEDTDSWHIVSDCTALPLMFRNRDNAEQFFKCFEDLFNKVKVLYKLTR